MLRVLTGLVISFCLTTIACERPDENRPAGPELDPPEVGDVERVEPELMLVEGCLTSSEGRFVLTDLDRGVRGPKAAERQGERPAAEPEPKTETYRLIGMDASLEPLVGERVEISGSVEPEEVVDVRETAPAVPPRSESGTTPEEPAAEEPTPEVGTVETTRLRISDLQVRSVTATGERCAAELRQR